VKKLIPILLVLLLLSGCGKNPAQPAAQLPQATEIQDTEVLVSLYDADSEAETQTDGAVRVYPLGDELYTGLLPCGKKLLVVSGGGELTLLQGERGEIAATTATQMSSAWASTDLCAGAQGIAYYSSDTMEVVMMDEQMQVTARIPMPEDMQGKPIIQLSKGEIVYCTVGQIRTMSMQTGISRMIRSHECLSQELLGSFFDDTVIACMVVNARGAQSVIYVDAQTGEKLYEDQTWGKLFSNGAHYYAQRPGEESQQNLFGQRGGQTMRLEVPGQTLHPVLEMRGAVGYAVGESGLELGFYDLETGTQQSAVTVPGMEEPSCIVSDGKYVWLLAGKNLYRWDITMSPVSGDAVYAAQLYTSEAPDMEGLEQCRTRADQLEQTYGFTLNIWQEAEAAGSDFGAVGEYAVDAIQAAMDSVEAVLSKLPEDFLSITGDVRIHLVRRLEDGAAYAHYWENGAYNLVLAGTDVTEWLLWGLGNAVDTRVLGNSFDYDTWDKLNPWWFDYTYDYEENLHRNDPENCLEGSNRYFTDAVAMSFPTEDRSRLFANALMEGNDEMFQANPMQKKLRTICIAIREAYDYQEHTEFFAWEQYLEKPIAPND